jgi:hypothetical protein
MREIGAVAGSQGGTARAHDGGDLSIGLGDPERKSGA